MEAAQRNHPAWPERRGFSLLELAIVLGVMGVIIGGVFAASSLVQYRMLLNQGSDELNLTAGNVRNWYMGGGVPAGLAACPPSFATAFSTQVFPKEMLNGAVVNSPWNITSPASTVLVGPCQGAVAEFVVRYTSLKAAVCSDLVVHNSLPGRDTGLVQVNINGNMVGKATSAATVTPLPIPPINATQACSSANTNTVDWYYSINN